MIWTSTSSSPPHRAATVRTMIISFQDLVDDVLVHILCMLPLGDVLSVRQVSSCRFVLYSFGAHLLNPLDIEAASSHHPSTGDMALPVPH